MINTTLARTLGALALGVSALAALPAHGATIKILNGDPAGVGFNDPTPVAPVGGNPGTTLGQQRLNLYNHVAGIWGARLTSAVTIYVAASWEALSCNSTGAVLGSAGAAQIFSDFPNAKFANTWYSSALANKLAGVNQGGDPPTDVDGNVDIISRFNVNLGQPGCLDGAFFYLGYDGNAGPDVDFQEVLLHELGHGLGFQTFTSGSTGQFFFGIPDVWTNYMYDNTAKKTWVAMTDAERQASAINPLQLAWIGPKAVAGAKSMLAPSPTLKIATPAPGYAGAYLIGTASFGSPIGSPVVTGSVAPLTTLACAPLTLADAAKVSGKIAMIDRGSCNFTVKAKAAQDAGALGVLIADNDPTATTPAGLGGADDTVTIPAARITYADGVKLKQAVLDAAKYGTRTKPGAVTATLWTDPTKLAGADASGRPLLYTPSVLSPGSSVSHWDTSATPNLLMEPAINSDLGTVLVPPKDLTFPLLQDIGW